MFCSTFLLLVLIANVRSDIIFTECQANFLQNQPGNENINFTTDNIPCSQLARGATVYDKWTNYLENGFYIVPYFFEDGYENHVYSIYNSTESMANMEELLGLFEQHTCVKFKKLTTVEEKASYDYKLEIIWNGVTAAASYVGRLSSYYQPQPLWMRPDAWSWNENTTMQCDPIINTLSFIATCILCIGSFANLFVYHLMWKDFQERLTALVCMVKKTDSSPISSIKSPKTTRTEASLSVKINMSYDIKRELPI